MTERSVAQTDSTAGGDGVGRRTVLKAAGVSAATAALAGCSALLGGDGDDGGDGGSTDGGTITSDALQAGLLSFTQGPAAVLGLQAVRGAEKAVESINENGGIAGRRQVNLDVVDEGSNAVDKYNQFIEDGKDVTFGPISSGTHESLAPEIESAQVINVGTDGTVTTLYEETVADPTYSFRFQNYDVMEAVTSTLEAIERIGADNINTVAGINPNYAFGKDEMEIFSAAVEAVTGAEVVYSGFPDLLADDFSTHISSVNSEQPDLVFSSCWGGDASTLLSQAFQRNMFENIEAIVGPVFYGSADAIDEEVVTGVETGKILTGSRNYYWGVPPLNRTEAGRTFFEEARQQEGITVPTAHYMSGYGAVTAWATAVERAIEQLGTYPSQEEISMALEEHGFYTPGGFFQMCQDHQGRGNGYAGVMEWDSDLDAPIITDVNTYPVKSISPPPQGSAYEVTALDWLNSWG
jgi:branched-chain amino acid transport system substrate-binding protein